MAGATVTLSKTIATLGETISITVRNSMMASGSYSLTYAVGSSYSSNTIASGSDAISSKTFSWTIPTSSGNSLVQAVMASGSANVTINWSIQDTYGGLYITGSASLTVQRAGAPTFSIDSRSYSVGDTVTFTVGASSNLYTHTITYSSGSQSGTAVAQFGGLAGAQTKTWTIPSDLQMGDNIVFMLSTLYGTTTVGTASQTASLTAPIWLSDSTPNVGDTVTVGLGQSGTWSLYWVYDGIEHLIANNVTGTSYDWTIPAAVAMAFETRPSDTITVRGKLSGANYDTSAFVSVPNESPFRPSVSVTLAPHGEAMTVQPSTYYRSIRGVQATISASSAYSGIASYRMEIEGKTVTRTGASPVTVQSNYLQQNGLIPVVITVTDNRGYQAVWSASVTVADYNRPAITPYTGYIRATAERSGDSDTDLIARFGATCTVINGAEGSAKLKIDNGEWVTVGTTTGGSLMKQYTAVNALPDITSVYRVYLSIEDGLGLANVLMVEVPSSGTPLHLAELGRRIGLGGFVDNTTPDRIHAFWQTVFHRGADVSNALCGTLDGGSGAWAWTQTWDALDLFTLFSCEVVTLGNVTDTFLAVRSGNVLHGYRGAEEIRMSKTTIWGLDSCTVSTGSQIRVIAII